MTSASMHLKEKLLIATIIHNKTTSLVVSLKLPWIFYLRIWGL